MLIVQDVCFAEVRVTFKSQIDYEILADISRVANNQFGQYVLVSLLLTCSFVINKLLNFQESMIKAVSSAILTAHPPLATNHHGVQFVEFVLGSNRILQRANIIKYLDALCSQEDGWVDVSLATDGRRTPSIVTVANSSVGRGHLRGQSLAIAADQTEGVLRQIPHTERAIMGRVHSTCRQFQTTLRNSQSGNELLRSL